MDEYFEQTEHAVRHAYAGLDSCWSYVERAQHYAPTPVREGNMLALYPPATPEEEEKSRHHGELLEKYFELKFSETMFAGFVLQTAHMAISLYSPCRAVPESCFAFVNPENTRAAPFCIGKERYGVPTGLVVYAGRNQYAHWDEKNPHPTTERVFQALNVAFANNAFADLAFSLSNPGISIFAGEVLFTALDWRSYETYVAEMTELLRE